MGAKNSKPPPAAAAPATIVNRPTENQVVSNSSGFHVFEFHMPSAGATLFMIMGIGLMIWLGMRLYRCFLRKAEKRRRREETALPLHHQGTPRQPPPSHHPQGYVVDMGPPLQWIASPMPRQCAGQPTRLARLPSADRFEELPPTPPASDVSPRAHDIVEEARPAPVATRCVCRDDII